MPGVFYDSNQGSAARAARARARAVTKMEDARRLR